MSVMCRTVSLLNYDG